MSDSEEKVLTDQVRGLSSKDGDDPVDRDDTARVLRENRRLSAPLSEKDAQARMLTCSRRGFLAGGAATAIAVFGWRWMSDETKDRLLRGTFELNERVSQILYRPT